VPLAELGPPLDPDALVRLDLPQPRFSSDRIDAMMLYVDSFGNIALNLTREEVERIGLVPGSRVELELSGERYFAVAARTFADARPGDVILYEDSYRNMSIAINRGSAAAMLHAEPGQPLGIRILGAPASMR
jgi:S-adenosylmethionine hydrolase